MRCYLSLTDQAGTTQYCVNSACPLCYVQGQSGKTKKFYILVASLCCNLIRPETNEMDIIRIANRALLIMREIKKRRPNWKFQFCPNNLANSKETLKKQKSNQKYFSKISRLKNFLIINQILSQIEVDKNYEENSHLFEALKGTKREGKNYNIDTWSPRLTCKY